MVGGRPALVALIGALVVPQLSPASPNLALITLDTTRDDRIGALTPHLAALAARGVRFERCDASAALTLPSHATLLTGLYPPRHGVRDNGAFVLDARFDTVAEILARRGYDTAAVVASVVLAGGYGLDQGFRLYDDDTGGRLPERDAAAVTTAALAKLGTLGRPFFLWVHYYDPHFPYRPPAGFPASDGEAGAYDAEVAFLDAEIGRLLAALGEDTTVLVVGDHGEMLGEHGEQLHGLLPFAGARRVPLLLAGPGVPRGRSLERLSRTVDVAPTLLELAGVPSPQGLDGRSLLPLDRLGEAPVAYWESFFPYFAYRWYPLRALSDGERLYIHGPEPALYDVAAGERKIAASPSELAAWTARLRALLGTMGEEVHGTVATSSVATPTASTEARRQLQSLGYLAGAGSGRVAPALPDPRHRTEDAALLQTAAAVLESEGCDGFRRHLDEILRRDANPAAHLLAGRCRLRDGNPEAALASFHAAGAEESALVWGYRAEAELRLGREEAAALSLRRALESDPVDTRPAALLVRLLRRHAQLADALGVADRVLGAGGHDAELYFERAMARVEAGVLDGAYDDFLASARHDPAAEEPLANAAGLAVRLGRHREAAQVYERLLRLAPRRADLWRVLGELYARNIGDPAAAARCYRRAPEVESSE